MPSGRHLSVEARLSTSVGGSVPLTLPPRASAGTAVTGFAATDDRGAPLRVQRTGSGVAVEDARPGAIRFRYRLDFTDSIAGGSTTSGLASTRLYAVARSLFVAPDPVATLKTSRRYPLVRVRFALPEEWRVIASWDTADAGFVPRSGDDLLSGILAAGSDYRTYSGVAAGLGFRVAVRGRRAFTDSALVDLIASSLRHSLTAFGPLPVARVTYVSDAGRVGRTSGSLQGTSTIGLLWEPGELLERPRGHDTFHETLHLWFGGAMEAERWWTEGVTDYFAARLYADWRGDPRDLAALCYESWRNYERIPHRTSMTMSAESRAMRGGDNTALLVYRKGMLAGLLLDAALRRGSEGRQTLDSVGRRLLALAADRRSRTVTELDIRDAVVAGGGPAAAREWARTVSGTDPVTLRQVSEALRGVTGVDLPPPPVSARVPKRLASTPNR